MNTTYKSNNNVVYSCKYHVVWCPKYRRKVLTNGVDTRLKELLTEYAANLSVEILEMEIMPDHVHMLLEVDPQFGIHKAVKSFKNNLYTVDRKARALWENFFHLFLSYILYNGKGRGVMLRLFSFFIVFCIVSCGFISFAFRFVSLSLVHSPSCPATHRRPPPKSTGWLRCNRD